MNNTAQFFFFTLGGDWELIQWIGNKQKRKYPQIILHAETARLDLRKL